MLTNQERHAATGRSLPAVIRFTVLIAAKVVVVVVVVVVIVVEMVVVMVRKQMVAMVVVGAFRVTSRAVLVGVSRIAVSLTS